MVTNQQLYLAIGVPMLFNVILTGMVVAHFNSRFDDFKSHFDVRLGDLRDLWRAELRRVEEIIDARLRHLEEQR